MNVIVTLCHPPIQARRFRWRMRSLSETGCPDRKLSRRLAHPGLGMVRGQSQRGRIDLVPWVIGGRAHQRVQPNLLSWMWSDERVPIQ